MLISQDEIRLGILNVKDRFENPTADLIKTIDGLTYDQGEELFALFIIRIQRMTAKLNNMGVLPKN